MKINRREAIVGAATLAAIPAGAAAAEPPVVYIARFEQGRIPMTFCVEMGSGFSHADMIRGEFKLHENACFYQRPGWRNRITGEVCHCEEQMFLLDPDHKDFARKVRVLERMGATRRLTRATPDGGWVFADG